MVTDEVLYSQLPTGINTAKVYFAEDDILKMSSSAVHVRNRSNGKVGKKSRGVILMTIISTTELNALSKHYQELLQSQQTLLLSTVSEQGIPDISYAPFIRDQAGCFNIYVSELASHTRNLLNNPQTSVLFIRPEAESKNLFARERAVISCSVKEIARDDVSYPVRLHALQERFGEVITLLSTLNDFHLFALCPQSGRYVVGFGRAFKVNVADDTVLPL
ncbi:MAG: pyridoxamine 5'-phosphate oxidase family protein [Methylococcaceae bacterium]